ncbi:hypothetical protein AMK59_3280 [Oryctes borbonicus]|uniref:Uncharacterized protein n=1 Tax=Oryctes borbonicus TaxID=1629725 RepID=A0A0T6B512_9SCAR|nr:hypothetical protein AMK59_3280 [Oryctes borbonicus]
MKYIYLVFVSILFIELCYSSAIEHNYYWRDYRSKIPDDAIKGTSNLYISQVYFEGNLPATLYPQRNEAVTECRGHKRVIKYPVKVLCDRRKDNFEWEHVNVDFLTAEKLKDMVVGGFEVNFTLYIGRVFHEGEWKIGKVFPPPYYLKGLTVWNKNSGQYITHDFEILRYLGKPATYDCPFDVRAA